MDKCRKKKRTKTVHRKYRLLAVMILFLAAACALFFGRRWLRNRGTAVFPDRDCLIRDEAFYGQKDERWAEDKLGTSRYTMRSSGCLVCCIAASLELQGRDALNPGNLNQELSRNSGYDEEGNLQWEALSVLDGRISSERCRTVNPDELKNNLEAGRFPIVRVRLNGVGSVHYVLIIGAKDGQYWCMDPLRETKGAVPLSNFGNKVYAVRYVDFYDK